MNQNQGDQHCDKLVILAGGISSRMKNALAVRLSSGQLRDIQSKPKCMIRVGRSTRPFLDYLLINAQRAGFRDVTIVTGQGDNTIEHHYQTHTGQGELYGMQFSYVEQRIPKGQTKPAGTAEALQLALLGRRDWQGRQFVVCNSDNLYSASALSGLRTSLHPNAVAAFASSALIYSTERMRAFAILRRDAHGYLRQVIEKPGEAEVALFKEEKGEVYVSMNLWKFHYDMILPYLQAAPVHTDRSEKELPTAVNQFVKSGPEAVFAIPFHEHVPDLTHPGDIPVLNLL